jgi:hypothetical protein
VAMRQLEPLANAPLSIDDRCFPVLEPGEGIRPAEQRASALNVIEEGAPVRVVDAWFSPRE